jgi:hypothetical protein
MKNLLTIPEGVDYDWTNNRAYYNKLRKRYLENQIEISCSFCRYNKGENSTNKYYGGRKNKKGSINYPSWKLVSNNKKQWMKKDKLVITEEKMRHFSNETYVFFNF